MSSFKRLPAVFVQPASVAVAGLILTSQFALSSAHAAGAYSAPSITAQPLALVVKAGQPASFAVTATSASAMHYQWFRNSVPLAGATSSTYTLPVTALTDSYTTFYVHVTNANSTTYSSGARLIVNPSSTTTPTAPTTPATPPAPAPSAPPAPAPSAPPAPAPTPAPAPAVLAPSITIQPASATANSGQPVTFAVTAASSVPATYQWARNGAPIPGAIGAVYTIPATRLADNSTNFSVTVTNSAGTVTSANARLTVNAVLGQHASADRLFSDQSLWNSRPATVQLGTYQIPKGPYYPSVSAGDYSVGAFPASASDPSMDVLATLGSAGIWMGDSQIDVPKVTIPHWPAGVVPAAGTDGHADIIDVANNRIHSFYQLRQIGGVWYASTYSWTALDGRGWGTPAQPVQGVRAAGVPPIAGLIRTKELNDGLPTYRHALAMSVAVYAMSPTQPYVFPATSADRGAATMYKGQIPMGSLMMLPATFDTSHILDPRLLKIVRTLQSYGAYVVDTSPACSFGLYVEIGSGFQLMPSTGWDTGIANQLDLIRQAIRQVTSATDWVDANGASFTPEHNLNALSLRGRGFAYNGKTGGTFDTWQQADVFPNNGIAVTQVNSTTNEIASGLWGAPQPGKNYTLAVSAEGGATLRLAFGPLGSKPEYTTAVLGDGNSVTFTWPTDGASSYLFLTSGPAGGGTVSATLLAAP